MAINKVPILDDGDRLYDDVMPERLGEVALSATIQSEISDSPTVVAAVNGAIVAADIPGEVATSVTADIAGRDILEGDSPQVYQIVTNVPGFKVAILDPNRRMAWGITDAGHTWARLQDGVAPSATITAAYNGVVDGAVGPVVADVGYRGTIDINGRMSEDVYETATGNKPVVILKRWKDRAGAPRVQRSPQGIGLFIGDSHTQSVGASDATFGWVWQSCTIAASWFFSMKSVNAGVGGEDSAQIISRLPALLAANPAFVVWESGANDTNELVTVADYVSRITAAWNMCRDLGIPFVLNTLPPKHRDVTPDAQALVLVDAYNMWLRSFCARNNIPLIDTWAALVNPATGRLRTEYSNDVNQHLNNLGHAIWATLAAEVMRSAVQVKTLPAQAHRQTNLVANGFATGAGTTPDGWSTSATGAGSVTYSIVDDTTYGRAARAEVTDAKVATISIPATLTTSATGDMIALTAVVKIEDLDGNWVTNARAHTAGVEVRLKRATGSSYFTTVLAFSTGRKIGTGLYQIGPIWHTNTLPATPVTEGVVDVVITSSAGAHFAVTVTAVEVTNLTALALTDLT